ncbi:MAG: (d)CMP kinase [Candidatus Dormibacteraceae bacterium]
MPIEIRSEPLVVAIDGPAGAGKSTVAQQLARTLGLPYVDSGATYRAAALKVLEKGIPPALEDRVVELVASAALEGVAGAGAFRVLLDGRDVTAEIRSAEVAQLASVISRFPGVRQTLVTVQRRFGRGRGVVMEGRDIGTVVFPNAALKIYLTASPLERARRRMADEQGPGVSLEKVAQEIERRDQRDSEREFSPLVPAADAHLIDSTRLNAADVVERVLQLLKEKNLIQGGEISGQRKARADST